MSIALADTQRNRSRSRRTFTLAARHRSVYPVRLFVVAGGLVSYGPDSIAPYRRMAGYVDRILKGDKPADLPV